MKPLVNKADLHDCLQEKGTFYLEREYLIRKVLFIFFVNFDNFSYILVPETVFACSGCSALTGKITKYYVNIFMKKEIHCYNIVY